MKRTPLKRGTSQLKRTTSLKFRSKKTTKLYREERIPLVIEMLEERPICELGQRFIAVDPNYQGCTHEATCLHELKKRSAGGSIVDKSNCLSSCWNCNMHVENFPQLAYEAGLVIKAWES